MRTKFTCLKVFAGICRLYGGLTAMAAVFISFSSLPHDIAGFLIAVFGGAIGVVGFFAVAEFIDMMINASHDLDDIRFHLSTISKPWPDSEQPTGDSTVQATDKTSE